MQMTQELTERQYYAITRKYKKIKLRQIAEELNCSVPLLSMYENNKTDINDYYATTYKQIIDSSKLLKNK